MISILTYIYHVILIASSIDACAVCSDKCSSMITFIFIETILTVNFNYNNLRINWQTICVLFFNKKMHE